MFFPYAIKFSLQPEESGIWPGAAMNLNQAKPAQKQLNLHKLGDADGFQIHWPATLAKTDSSSYFGIIPLNLTSSKNRIYRENVTLPAEGSQIQRLMRLAATNS